MASSIVCICWACRNVLYFRCARTCKNAGAVNERLLYLLLRVISSIRRRRRRLWSDGKKRAKMPASFVKRSDGRCCFWYRLNRHLTRISKITKNHRRNVGASCLEVFCFVNLSHDTYGGRVIGNKFIFIALHRPSFYCCCCFVLSSSTYQQSYSHRPALFSSPLLRQM